VSEEKKADVFQLSEKEQILAFVEELITHSEHSLIFCTEALAPELLNHAHISHLLAAFVRKNRRNLVRFLICQSDVIEQRGHHMVTLAQKLPSFVKIRKIPLDYQEAYASMLIHTSIVSDGSHGLFVPHQLSGESATAMWHQKAKVSALVRDFELLWERSEEIVGFRRLGI